MVPAASFTVQIPGLKLGKLTETSCNDVMLRPDRQTPRLQPFLEASYKLRPPDTQPWALDSATGHLSVIVVVFTHT